MTTTEQTAAQPALPTPSTETRRNLTRAAVPLITLAATYVARKGMIKGYESSTGKKAPLIHSRNGSVMTKVAWAATMAAVITLIEVVVWNVLDGED